MAVVGSYTQQPTERLAYPYSPVRDMSIGDVLVPASTVVTISPTGSLVADLVNTNTLPKLSPELQTEENEPLVTIWLTGALNGTRYKVTVKTVSSSGAIMEDEFYVRGKNT